MTATLSSVYPNLLPPTNADNAAKCIDGNTDGPDAGWMDGESLDLCNTDDEHAPWLAIDYGTQVTVQRVELFIRMFCCGERTRNVDVRVSNNLPTSGSQMFSGGTLLGHFAGPATDGQHITISGQYLQKQTSCN